MAPVFLAVHQRLSKKTQYVLLALNTAVFVLLKHSVHHANSVKL